jgi:hypothetical protein
MPPPVKADTKPTLAEEQAAAAAATAKEKQTAADEAAAKGKAAAPIEGSKQAANGTGKSDYVEKVDKEPVVEEKSAAPEKAAAPARGTSAAAAAQLDPMPDDPRQKGAKIVDRPMTVGAD